jgi:hypothetical protein
MAGDDNRAFEHVPELANISGPDGIPEVVENFRVHAGNVAIMLLVKIGQDRIADRGDVVFPFPKRRQGEVKDV